MRNDKSEAGKNLPSMHRNSMNTHLQIGESPTRGRVSVPVVFLRPLLYNGPSGFKEHHYEQFPDQSDNLRGISDGGCDPLFTGVASRKRSAQV
jgi:hypothetical protein